MPLEITFTLSDDDLDRFQASVDKTRVAVEDEAAAASVEQAARKLLEETSTGDVPGFITACMTKLRVVIEMIDDKEWNLSDEDLEHLFLRYWTAKEAVLKVAGTGIRELAYCRIAAVPDEEWIQLDFKGEPFRVRQFYHDRHVIAVVDVGCPIELRIIDS